jgi:uroporphyrinogen-III decarboxylase
MGKAMPRGSLAIEIYALRAIINLKIKFMNWRDFDLTKRCEKITRAFNREEVKSPEDVPVIINTPCYFQFANKPRQSDYYSNPASMVKFQEDSFMTHLSSVHDDTVPYFMPWFGTGILAASFGCGYKLDVGEGDDPAVVSTIVKNPADAAKIKLPDLNKNEWTTLVLKFIDYAKKNSDLPIGLTDMNSPLCTMRQMCGTEVYTWMYEEPNLVKDMMSMITDKLIEWVKLQKQHIGEPLDSSNGLQGVWSPKGVGIWLSDDDLVMLSPEFYEEFVVPYYSKIFSTFGGGSVHFCGNGAHMGETLLKIKNIKVVNNSPLGNFDAYEQLYNSIGGKVTIQLQDCAPINMDDYYSKLFDRMTDLRGVMLGTFVLDTLGMDGNGGYEFIKWDPLQTANNVVSAVRKSAEKVLSKK